MGKIASLELAGGHDRPQVEILMDGGPLCVGRAWDWNESRERHDLFRIYHKKLGMALGPFYVTIPLAVGGMKKAIKLGRHIWEDAHQLAEQKWLHRWIDEQLGKAGDLVGGTWVKDDEVGNDGAPG